MKVTIVTVTLNSEISIQHCIQSVNNQTFENIEHIIVDGKSTDNTLLLISSTPSRIKTVVSEKDKGIYDAINKGIQLASGDIVGILNSDDFLATPYVIEKIVNEFVKNNSIQAVYADLIYVDRNNINEKKRYYSSKYFQPWMFRFGFQPAHPTFYAKKSVFLDYGLYRTDLKISGDFELLARMLFKKKISFKYVQEVWVNMRIGGISNSSFSSRIKLNKEIISACRYNKIYTNIIFVYSKYFFKWISFFN